MKHELQWGKQQKRQNLIHHLKEEKHNLVYIPLLRSTITYSQ